MCICRHDAYTKGRRRIQYFHAVEVKCNMDAKQVKCATIQNCKSIVMDQEDQVNTSHLVLLRCLTLSEHYDKDEDEVHSIDGGKLKLADSIRSMSAYIQDHFTLNWT